MTTKQKAIVLLSGGLDSATCLAIAKNEGFECYALSFEYGQKHQVELSAAKIIAQQQQVKAHKIVSLAALQNFGGSSLTDHTIEVENFSSDAHIPNTYVPARNTIFLSIALAWAEVIQASHIFIGSSNIDYSGYPDCRPEYFAAFQYMANLATKSALEGNQVQIKAPLLHLNKAQTILLGNSLGVDYQATISCYAATTTNLACGACPSCHYRSKGFKEAGLPDPAMASNYQ